MSYTFQITLWCDKTGCAIWEMFSGRKIRSIRKEASLYGWTTKQGKDYCPKCPQNPPARGI